MKAICYVCKKEFERKPALLKRAKRPTCSEECRNVMYKTQRKEIICDYCLKPFIAKKYYQEHSKKHFCCKEHSNLYLSKTRHKDKIKTTCPICNKVFEIYDFRTKDNKVICCSRSCATKYQLRDKTKHWHYNENITDEERIERRKLKENVEWRNKVFEKDNYTCNICKQYGGKLEAHHLNGYNWDKENRLNVENGITLCQKHHKEFHKKYGNKNNTKEQFLEYVNQSGS